MQKGFLAEAHPAKQLLFTCLIIIAAWIVFQLIGMFSGILVFGLTINDIAGSLESIGDPVFIAYLKYVQAFTSAGMFIVAAIVSAWYIDPEWKTLLALKNYPGWVISLLAVLFTFIILPFTNLLTYYNANMVFPEFLSGLESFFRGKEEQMTEVMEAFLKPGGAGGLVFNILVIAIIPAVGEELIFRGLIQKLLTRWFANPHWAIIITAFFFSAIHFQFLSFVPRFFLGLVLGYLFYWSGSIWLTILVHFINNAIATVFYFYYYGGTTGNFLEKAGTPESGIALAFIGGIAGFTLLFLIRRLSLKEKIVN